MSEVSIKELRARNNLTQRDVAKAIGISVQTYNNWEVNGIALVKLENIKRLADYYGVPLDTIKVTPPMK